LLGKLGGLDNQLIAGVAADFADTRFSQFDQDANFTPSRAAIGSGDFSLDTDAKTRNATYGIYLSDTLALSPHWALTLAGRYNWAKVKISDQTGDSPLLNGNHNFSRFNPAVGLNWNPVPGFTAYASYNEGMRSPTAIELACADPAAPCSLPNDFLADPALKPVISKTFEVGARGRVGFHTHWNAAVYNTTLTDDIQFISTNGASTNSGFFQNVGKTRRRGFELGGDTRFGPLGVAVNYSYVNATYQSSWTENSGSNSAADSTGTIQVKPGDRIPGIPQDTIKVRFDYAATPKWNVGANLIYRTSIFARGDENNQDVNGSVAGYMLVNLDTTYQVSKSLQVFARVDNLLNKRYADFSILGENFFNGPNHTFDGNNTSSEQFLGLGAPRGFWIGLRYAWL
jgi:outer membrane receptor protein involved in Fe transport